MRYRLVVLITRYSIFSHGTVNLFTETNKYLKFYFLHSHIFNLYFFLSSVIIKQCRLQNPQNNKDQLLLDGYRYRCANKSQVIWRYCKNNCADRVRFDGVEYVKVMDDVHSPNPEEFISMKFKSIMNTGATTSHDSPRRIIHEALLHINKNICALKGQKLFSSFDTHS